MPATLAVHAAEACSASLYLRGAMLAASQRVKGSLHAGFEALPFTATAQILCVPSSLAQALFLPSLMRCRPTAAAQLAALCAGHWNALEAMAATADATGGLVVLDQHQWAVLLRAYQRIAATCPYLATPAFFHPLRQAMQQVRLPAPKSAGQQQGTPGMLHA